MQHKQRNSRIYNIIAVSICIIMVAFFVLPLQASGICNECLGVFIVAPFALFIALVLSVLSVYRNKRSIVGWLVLVLVCSLIAIPLYLLASMQNLPFGAGTR
ncbi:hypothetical protein ACI6Q2_09670 [Chitinophagaceae bacterium LWZ2-11]